MRNKKNILFLIIILLICILAYYFYPRIITLNSILFNNYNKENIEEIEIRSTSSRQDKSIKDKDEINNILTNFSNIKLVKHYGDISNRTKGSYHIYIYDKNSIPIEIVIQGKEYINIINDHDKSNKEYKIVDNSLNANYINELISQ